MGGLFYIIGMTLLWGVIALTVIHVVMDNRQPAKTMAWALVILFLPLVGIVLYIFFGINHRRERLVSQRSLDQLSKRSMLGFVEQQDLHVADSHKQLVDLFINQNLSLPFKVAAIDIMTDGYSFFPELLADIGRAKHHIHVRYEGERHEGRTRPGHLRIGLLVDGSRACGSFEVDGDGIGFRREVVLVRGGELQAVERDGRAAGRDRSAPQLILRKRRVGQRLRHSRAAAVQACRVFVFGGRAAARNAHFDGYRSRHRRNLPADGCSANRRCDGHGCHIEGALAIDRLLVPLLIDRDIGGIGA